MCCANDWGFKGFVVSDAFAVGSLVTHGYARDRKTRRYKAFRAGLNMDMAGQTYTHESGQAVGDGKVTMRSWMRWCCRFSKRSTSWACLIIPMWTKSKWTRC